MTEDKLTTEDNGAHLVELAAELTIAWLGNPNNRATAEDVPAFLRNMHSTVSELSGAASAADGEDGLQDQQPQPSPAVSVRKSLASKDHILSMIDGKPYKTLRRHLSTHGMTPDEYRQRFGLKSDYPMVAPNYSEQRSAMAKKFGLGAKGRHGKADADATPPSAPAPKRRNAKTKADTSPPAPPAPAPRRRSRHAAAK